MTDEREDRQLSISATVLIEETSERAAKTARQESFHQQASAMAAAVGNGGKSLAAKGAREAKNAASVVGQSAAKAAQKTVAITEASASSLGNVAKAAGAHAVTAVDQVGKLSAKTAAAAAGLAHTVGDLNGDGKVDEEDFRIVRDAVSRVVTVVGTEAAAVGKGILQHEMTKDAMAGAAIGAVVAVPIPFVGPALGAAAGAAFAVTRGVLAQPATETLAGQAITAGASAAAGLAKSAMKPAKGAKKPKSKTAGAKRRARSKPSAPPEVK